MWNGLWHGEHARRMKEAVYLFGFLLSCANKQGVVRIRYRDLSDRLAVAERTLSYWMARLKREGYVVVEKSSTMVITIQKFRRIKKEKDHEPSSKDVADDVPQSSSTSKNETSQPVTETSCNGLHEQPQDLAEENSANADKQGTSPPPLNTSKIKDKNKPRHPPSSKPVVHQLIDHCKNEFQRIHNIANTHYNGAACSTLKKLSASRPIDEVKGLITQYLSLDDEALKRKGYPIEWMMTRLNELLINNKSAVLERTEEEERVHQERIRRGAEAHEKRMQEITV